MPGLLKEKKIGSTYIDILIELYLNESLPQ